jgi:hypothetical protein
LIFLFLACEKIELPDQAPNCLKKTIRRPANGTTSPVSVWQYEWKDQLVFVFSPGCCDINIEVYDSNCNYLCSPSGGFTGHGDGTCPDFYSEAKNGILIWED